MAPSSEIFIDETLKNPWLAFARDSLAFARISVAFAREFNNLNILISIPV